MNEAGDSTAHNGTPDQVKEEEEEMKEQPAAKRRRGRSKKEIQTKTEEMPKEEIKGNVGQIFI